MVESDFENVYWNFQVRAPQIYFMLLLILIIFKKNIKYEKQYQTLSISIYLKKTNHSLSVIPSTKEGNFIISGYPARGL